MLKKIICIDNVGVIKKGIPQAVDLDKLSLVYADNARGKSTLSSLLLACAGSTAKDIVERKTIGSTTPQKIVLRFEPQGAPAFNAEFDGSAWKGPKPNLHVFNQAFVERNVFASTGVTAAHRESLMTLALGDAAVTERGKYEQLTAQQADLAKAVTLAEAPLLTVAGLTPINIYMKMQPLVGVDSLLTSIDFRISEARAAKQIAAREEFKLVEEPKFDFADVLEVAASSFESASANAAEMAKNHFEKHLGTATEKWVSEGLSHTPDDDCPFCGQATTGLPLIDAYKNYFDKAYTDHLLKVSNLASVVEDRLSFKNLFGWRETAEFNKGLRSVWTESLGLIDVPSLKWEVALGVLGAVKKKLGALIDEKVKKPLLAMNPQVFVDALGELNLLQEMAATYNDKISDLNDQIAAYKHKHAAPDIDALTKERAQLQKRKDRYDPKIVDVVAAIEDARDKHKAIGEDREKARLSLDQALVQTLTQFQSAINDWLGKFAAPFTVDKLGGTHISGKLRSEYVLKVRGATVNVGPGTPGDLDFQTALSEGDKRTLAFAFFLAKLFADPNRSNAIVVLDDVFTSLDKHRRAKTAEAVTRMLGECAQVIPLAHDAHFLQHLKKLASKKKLAKTVELALTRDSLDYSFLDDKFDLDDFCSSDYYKYYRLVEDFVAAVPQTNQQLVAVALRLLVEGHLHRSFPGRFKDGITLGVMLDTIKSAVHPNPLIRLGALHDDLVNFNEYASGFHHDPSGEPPQGQVTETELLAYARSALGFIHARDFKHN